MKILFLGSNLSKAIVNWLEEQGEHVIFREEKITLDEVNTLKPDFIISYNFRFILPKEIIEAVNGRLINLHISLLPYNKGAHPNVWSFLEDTPKGVTIHYIDEGIDTGDILVQKEIYIDEERETLGSSYDILHRKIQTLFKANWEKIKRGELVPQSQKGEGSIHYLKEFSRFEHCIKEKGWDTPIRKFQSMYKSSQGT